MLIFFSIVAIATGQDAFLVGYFYDEFWRFMPVPGGTGGTIYTLVYDHRQIEHQF